MKRYVSILIIILMIITSIPSYAMETVKGDIAGHWAEKTIVKWKENQLMKGYPDGSFRPNDNITKAEFVTLINRIYGYYEKADKNYTDIKKQDWYYDSVSIAKANKYMDWHKEKELKPNKKITRQEVCAIIASIQQLQATEGLKKVNSFKDKDIVPKWSKAYIDAVINSGYTKGYPDNTIKAEGSITRAEVVTMLDRVVGKLISTSGTYGTDDKEQIIEGNLTINAQDVTLKNTKIKGNLILAAGIKEGEVDLVNVTVEGKTIINGGGENSITISGSRLGEVIVYKKGGKIRVVSKESVIKKFDLETPGKLEGDFKDTIITLLGADEIVDIDREVEFDGDFGEIVVESKMQIKISGEESIKKITVGAGAEGTSIDIEKGSSVREIEFNAKTNVKGKGKIKKAVVKADGVTIEQKVEKKQVTSGVDGSGVKESKTSSSGGNSGSNGSSGGYTRPKSSQKSIITTTIGTLENGNIIDVPEGTKVQDLKSALTVSQYASVEILITSGGTIVDNQATTDVTETMVIQVTAENKTKAEYNIKINDAPTAVDDTASVNEDSSVSIDVLANDSDIEGDSISIKSCTSGTNGSTEINTGNNTIKYTSNTNFNGTDSFTYEVEDEHGATNTATVTVTVNPVNDAPTAVDDTKTVDEDSNATTIDVLSNDSDIDEDNISIKSYDHGTDGENGTITHDGSIITYKPNTNFSGTDSFTYEVEDIHGATNTATVTVTVNPVNDAPTVVDDTAGVNENSSVLIDVLSNDSDIDEDNISIKSYDHGTDGANATITHDGSTITYNPNLNFNGTDIFTYEVEDANGAISVGTVTVTVNDAPTAVDDIAETDEDTAKVINVISNDVDVDGNILTIKSFAQGSKGTVEKDGDSLKYSPVLNFNGTDSFTYEVEDEHGATSIATVTVTVRPVNDAPAAKHDTVSVYEDTSLSIDVLANDSDIDGDSISISSCTERTNGSAVINPDNTITYTPNTDFNGIDSFEYTINDGNGGTAAAIVNVTVNPVNDAPTAVDDTVSVNENSSLSISVLANDSDIDGDSISISSCTGGTNGSAVINTGNKKITYTPNTDFYGTDSFEYTINDGNGETATARVNVTVIQVKSTEKEITRTEIGILDNGNIKDVRYGTKVSDFKAGLTVSKDASVEILASSKGSPVVNQENTFVSAAMVIEVTAEDGTKAEYTISTPFPDDYDIRWRLNESNNDEKGNYNLTGTNLPSYKKDSKEGSHSCYFDGNSELSTTNNYKFPNNEFTISTWVKFDSGMNNTDTIVDYDEIKISLYYYTLDNGNTHEIRGSINEDDGVVAADQNISQDEWHHVTLVWDGEKLKLYINSSLSDERDYTYDITVGNGSWYIGGWNGVDYNWKGHIDDVIIYDRALTNEEIIGIYYSY